MAATNINRVILTGNLTRDPELRSLPSGMSVCWLRIASNTRRKDSDGEWVDKPNYFSVTVWGAQGENCARFLSKGRPVAIDGRLEWREWEAQDGGKRESVEIVADAVQFLGGRDDAGSGNGFAAHSDVPADKKDFAPAPPPAAAPATTTSRSRRLARSREQRSSRKGAGPPRRRRSPSRHEKSFAYEGFLVLRGDSGARSAGAPLLGRWR